MSRVHDQLILGDCLEELKKLPDNSIDLVLTSPPYDEARDYKGNVRWEFGGIAQEIYRVLRPTGIVCWNVADQTKNFGESLTSFKQAISFVEDHGFMLVDTLIYAKNNFPAPYPNLKRYAHAFEYVFVLAKGREFYFSALKDRPNKYAGKTSISTTRKKDGSMHKLPNKVSPSHSIRT